MSDLFLIPFGALLYRWRGMAHPYKRFFPRPFNQAAFALPYALAAYFFWLPLAGAWAWAVFGLVWALTIYGALTGHGRGISLEKAALEGAPETLEFLIRPLEKRLPVYWYKVAILSVTGLAITLPVGIATLNPVLALSGALKGPAYMIGHFGTDRGAEAGEMLTGGFLWGSIF